MNSHMEKEYSVIIKVFMKDSTLRERNMEMVNSFGVIALLIKAVW